MGHPRRSVNASRRVAIEVAPWHGVKHGKAEVPRFFAGSHKPRRSPSSRR